MQNKPINQIIPYEFNNRNHSEEQINRIANSIQQFGFNQAIVIDENSVVLVGHGRLHAAQKLGLKEVPVLVKSDLTETQKKAYRILDNKLQNDSTWSFDNLELELGFLEDNNFELEPWGLDELRGMLDPEIDEDGTESKTLSDRFLVPPFSVLDARQGYWQDRKRYWLSLGIQSELGRGGASPGGSPRPAMTLGNDGKTMRGTGNGKILFG